MVLAEELALAFAYKDFQPGLLEMTVQMCCHRLPKHFDNFLGVRRMLGDLRA